jgi:hypothetical protein
MEKDTQWVKRSERQRAISACEPNKNSGTLTTGKNREKIPAGEEISRSPLCARL